ncbi:hypothetical protein NYO98_14130 [Nocardioides sp. STR2]|uniref:PRC-barrel domain-containing protein n=1 Tax=Nocardioides pini TaxID=2975053 RepID=A0ABT4CHQ1_9ACTN|nr:hypothetical protein [Nocardioides pini]MCY4727422.1 hypothetical protein [Nocardioides pini]
MNALWNYRPSVWDYRESTWTLDSDLVGYEVEATDGRLGSVVRATSSPGAAHLVVDAVPAAGRRVVPALAVSSIRHDERTVRVDLTRVQLLSAPAHEDAEIDDSVRARVDRYFSGLDRR